MSVFLGILIGIGATLLVPTVLVLAYVLWLRSNRAKGSGEV